jgi:hypothetical protein
LSVGSMTETPTAGDTVRIESSRTWGCSDEESLNVAYHGARAEKRGVEKRAVQCDGRPDYDQKGGTPSNDGSSPATSSGRLDARSSFRNTAR